MLLTQRSPPSFIRSEFSKPHRCMSEKMRKEKGDWSGIVLQTRRIKGEREYSLPSSSQILPPLPWMKVTVEGKHSQTIASFRIHTAHETHAADRCWLFFYLFYVNSPREICWIEVIISAEGVKTLVMKQPRWKVTFVFPAFSCENSWRSGNFAVNATWWQLKEFPCCINQIDRVYISKQNAYAWILMLSYLGKR